MVSGVGLFVVIFSVFMLGGFAATIAMALLFGYAHDQAAMEVARAEEYFEDESANTGALAVAQFFIVLIAFSMIFIFLNPRFHSIRDKAVNQTTNQTAQTAINDIFAFSQHLELIVVIISVFGLIVLAFYERRGGF